MQHYGHGLQHDGRERHALTYDGVLVLVLVVVVVMMW
jgi:hypothetical protein